MEPETIENSVARLERRMTKLEELPARVDGLTSQVLQLRQEMRAEFSAVRVDMQALNDRTMSQMRMLFEEMVGRMAVMKEGQSEAPKGKRKK